MEEEITYIIGPDPKEVNRKAEEVNNIFAALPERLQSVEGRLNNMAKSFKGVLDQLEVISERLIGLEGTPKIIKTYKDRPNQSATIGHIALALSKAKGSMKLATATGNVGMGNSKSADLGDLMQVAEPALAANELAITFDIYDNEHGEGAIECKLIHSSSEWLSSHWLLMEYDTMPNEKEIQKKRGSAITYCMKNMYRARLGLGVD